MACDLVVAAEGTKLGEPEIRYGSAPVTLLMPYLIGQKKTRELLLTGDLIDAVEAERIGLINRVVPADRLAAEVDALADRLARTPPEVMAPTKRMLNRAMDAAGFRLAVEAGLDLGRDHQRRRHARAARVGRDRPARRPQGRPGLARPALRRAPGRQRPGRRRRRRADRSRRHRPAERGASAPSPLGRGTKVPAGMTRRSGGRLRLRHGPVQPDALHRISETPFRAARRGTRQPDLGIDRGIDRQTRGSNRHAARTDHRRRPCPPTRPRRAAAAAGILALLLGPDHRQPRRRHLLAGHTSPTPTRPAARSPPGTIDIDAIPDPSPSRVTAMMPGDTVTAALTIANDGTAALRYAMTPTRHDRPRRRADPRDPPDSGTELRHVRRHRRPGRHRLDGAAFGNPAQGDDAGDRVLAAAAGEVLCFRVSLPLGTRQRPAGPDLRRDLHVRRRADRQQPVIRFRLHPGARPFAGPRSGHVPARQEPWPRPDPGPGADRSSGIAGGSSTSCSWSSSPSACASVVLGRVLPALGHPVYVVAGPSMDAGHRRSVAPSSSTRSRPRTSPSATSSPCQTAPARAVFTHRIIRVAERDGRTLDRDQGRRQRARRIRRSRRRPRSSAGSASPCRSPATCWPSCRPSRGVVLVLSAGAALLLLGWLHRPSTVDARRRPGAIAAAPPVVQTPVRAVAEPAPELAPSPAATPTAPPAPPVAPQPIGARSRAVQRRRPRARRSRRVAVADGGPGARWPAHDRPPSAVSRSWPRSGWSIAVGGRFGIRPWPHSPTRDAATGSFAADTLAPPTGLAATGGAAVGLTWTPTVDTVRDGLQRLACIDERRSLHLGRLGHAAHAPRRRPTLRRSARGSTSCARPPARGRASTATRRRRRSPARARLDDLRRVHVDQAADTTGRRRQQRLRDDPARTACTDGGGIAQDANSGNGGGASCGTGRRRRTRPRTATGSGASRPGCPRRSTVDHRHPRPRRPRPEQQRRDDQPVRPAVVGRRDDLDDALKSIAVNGTGETTYVFGGTTDTWGRTWTLAELGQLRVPGPPGRRLDDGQQAVRARLRRGERHLHAVGRGELRARTGRSPSRRRARRWPATTWRPATGRCDVQHAVVAAEAEVVDQRAVAGRPPGPGRPTARSQLLGAQLRDVAAGARRGTRAWTSPATSRRRRCASNGRPAAGTRGCVEDAGQVAQVDVAPAIARRGRRPGPRSGRPTPRRRCAG